AYGEAFKSELAGFDYWGFCDLDTIWGDLRKSLRAPLHGTYDRIFGGGHLSIFRNSSEVNEAYRQGGHADGTLNYRDVFTSSRSYAFDEWGLNQNGLNRIFEQKYSFYLDTMPYADVKPAHYA